MVNIRSNTKPTQYSKVSFVLRAELYVPNTQFLQPSPAAVCFRSFPYVGNTRRRAWR